jgi:putative ABC transport system ATP-binding protein
MRVVLEGAGVRFGDRVVFENLDAVFPAATVTSLVGPSGSGKSTVLGVIAGLRTLDSGTVAITNSDAGAAADPDPSSVAWIPQSSQTMPSRSVIDNVAIGGLSAGLAFDEASADAADLLARVGLIGVEALPARNLSGGELQRMSLARALASRKPIILADEPSASLDRANTERIAEILQALAVSATIVVATHDPILVAATSSVVDLRAEHRDG